MTPGIKTSEGRLALLKVLVSSAIAVCTGFGVAVPSWLRPDAPWVTVAALAVGGLVTVIYSAQRTSLKRTIALTGKPVAPVAPITPVAAPPVAPAGSAGYTIIGLLILITALILVAIGCYLLIVGAVVAHTLSATGLILLIIGIVVAVVGRHVEGGGRIL